MPYNEIILLTFLSIIFGIVTSLAIFGIGYAVGRE